jgi:chemotaxis protein MotB
MTGMSGAGVLPAGQYALLSKIQLELRRELQHTELGNQVTTELTERGLVLHLPTDGLLFDRGSADLKPATRCLLTAIGPSLRRITNPIRVEGHTCDLPIRSALFPSNWELSARRATNVLLYLITRASVSPDRAAAVGYGDTRPRVPNRDEGSRRHNRRVDIVLQAGPDMTAPPLADVGSAREYLTYLGGAAYELAARLAGAQSGPP